VVEMWSPHERWGVTRIEGPGGYVRGTPSDVVNDQEAETKMTNRRNLDQLARELPAGELPTFVADLERAKAVAWVRLATPAPPVPESAGLVDAHEMARLLDVPVGWLADRARSGTLPSIKVGHYRRYSPSEVLDAVRRLPPSHDCAFRGVKKTQQRRGEKGGVSTKCPSSSADSAPEAGNGQEAEDPS
jgi:hypothetical protein